MIVELRRYTLYPGMRDTLIDVFERHFIAGQEAQGIELLGHFRDIDDPDIFFWMRAFPSDEHRAASLAAFYGGPVWREHRDAANATMVDSSNVLQLRPVRSGAISRDGLVVATICYLREPADDALVATFEREIAPQVRAAGGDLLATFESDDRENVFPALPIREGVRAFVWFARYPEDDAPLPDVAALRDRILGHPETHRLRHP